MEKMDVIKIGPAGASPVGNAWYEKDRTEIVQIFISHDEQIDGIQFQYAAENGALVLSDLFGQNTGSKFDVVKFNYPSEYIICVTIHKSSLINSRPSTITFTTNHATYGPFGPPGKYAKEFRFYLGQDRQFGGFHGTATNLLQSIGVYCKPLTTLNPLKENDKTAEENIGII